MQRKLLPKQKKVAKKRYKLALQRLAEAQAGSRQGGQQSALVVAVLCHDADTTLKSVADEERHKLARVGHDVLAIEVKGASAEARNRACMCAEEALFWSSVFEMRRRRLARGQRSLDLRIPHGKPYLMLGG